MDKTLVVEAILREMKDAQRWMTIEEAWRALLNVNKIANSINAEIRRTASCEGTKEESKGKQFSNKELEAVTENFRRKYSKPTAIYRCDASGEHKC